MKKVQVLVIELLLGGNSIFRFNEVLDIKEDKAAELVASGHVKYYEESDNKSEDELRAKQAEEAAKQAELEAEEAAKQAELEANKVDKEAVSQDTQETLKLEDEDPLGAAKKTKKK